MKQQMSKALRIAVEEIPHCGGSFVRPISVADSGNNTPCSYEFYQMLQCLNKSKFSTCQKSYDELIKCIRKHTF